MTAAELKKLKKKKKKNATCPAGQKGSGGKKKERPEKSSVWEGRQKGPSAGGLVHLTSAKSGGKRWKHDEPSKKGVSSKTGGKSTEKNISNGTLRKRENPLQSTHIRKTEKRCRGTQADRAAQACGSRDKRVARPGGETINPTNEEGRYGRRYHPGVVKF